jgi:hypothetical protein
MIPQPFYRSDLSDSVYYDKVSLKTAQKGRNT